MDKFIEIFKKNYSKEKNIHLILNLLKKNGASQMDCTKILILEMKLSLSEADEIVINSPIWKENKDFNSNFRDSFFDFLENDLVD